MFWRFSYSTSQIQTLLERDDVTLKDILDEDDVLQECKSNNEKLIEFLTKEEHLEQLIVNVTRMPVNDLEEKSKFKYSNISCELLTSDMPLINDTLITNMDILDKLYSFLETSTGKIDSTTSSTSSSNEDLNKMDEQTPTTTKKFDINDETCYLNPLLASYFAKVVGILISRKTEQFLNYLDKKENFVQLFIKHVNTSAIMDILLRLLTTIDNVEMRTRVLEWLKRITIVEHLIELLSSTNSSQVHSNVSQVLCDIIRISREQIYSDRETYFFTNAASSVVNDNFGMNSNSNDFDFDDNITPFGQQQSSSAIASSSDSNSNSDQTSNMPPITNALLGSIESVENINKLLDLALGSVNEKNCSLVYGIEVLLTILEPKTSTYIEQMDSQCPEPERLKKEKERILIASNGIKNVVRCCAKRMDEFDRLLRTIKTNNESYQTTHGYTMSLFGSKRLAIVKLIAKLASINDEEIINNLVRLKTLDIIIDYVFQYKWNNFLHTQFSSIFTNLFSSNESLSRHIEAIGKNTDVKNQAPVASTEAETDKQQIDVDMPPILSSSTAEVEKMETNTTSDSATTKIEDASKPEAENADLIKSAAEASQPLPMMNDKGDPSESTSNLLQFKKDSKQTEQNDQTKSDDDGINNKLADEKLKRLVIEHLFTDCNVIRKFVDAWQDYFDEKCEKSAANEAIAKDSDIKEAKESNEADKQSAEQCTEEEKKENQGAETQQNSVITNKPSSSTPHKKHKSVGYIGHLTLVSNLIFNNTNEGAYSTFIKSYLNSNNTDGLSDTWQKLNETRINEINQRNSKDLVRNPLLSNSMDSNSDPLSSLVDIIEPPSDEIMQKKLKDLQKEMKINCVDNFSLSENHIINFQPKYPDLFNKLQNITFQMDSSDETMQLFEQVCSQRDNMCMAINETSPGAAMEDDMWITKEIKFDDEFVSNHEDSSSSSSSSDEAKNN